MTVKDFINTLNFDEYDYLYHVTGNGKAESIMEEGLLVNGTNILDTDNILFTTCAVLYPEDVVDEETFTKEILDGELGNSQFRDTNEMVIIGAPKDINKRIVDNFNENIDGVYYEGIVYNTYIMGYFNNEHQFTPNEEYDYGTNNFYEESNFRK